MKFTHGGLQYRLGFAHPIELRGKGKRQRLIRHTVCRLITGDTKETEKIVGEARATLNVKDRYSLEAGRVAALEKLLQEFEGGDIPDIPHLARTTYYNREGSYADRKERNKQTQLAIKAVRRILANRQRPEGWQHALAGELVSILEPKTAKKVIVLRGNLLEQTTAAQ